ncbi:MAG: hypothetical protein QNJ65_15785 [Xenococcaceae cyanobacterium MO_234.B1]|nr:hypothetical protein [Xenococcaceae cyanobacterium MO_234.B1]
MKYISKIIVAVLVSILAFDAIANMVLGSLGKTPETSEWNYILILYIFLATIGVIAVASNIKTQLKLFNRFQPLVPILSATLNCALLGFYYGGSMTNNNPQVGIITAIALGMIGTILSLKQQQIIIILTAPIATIAAYGFAFYAGTNAIALFNVSKLLGGILWGIICLIYIGITITNLSSTLSHLKGQKLNT